jgi:hypothetical protein
VVTPAEKLSKRYNAVINFQRKKEKKIPQKGNQVFFLEKTKKRFFESKNFCFYSKFRDLWETLFANMTLCKI